MERLHSNLCMGHKVIDVAFMTGFSAVYLSRLQKDPSFKELVQHYGNSNERLLQDTVVRMDQIGNLALDELQDRLLEKPQSFANRELDEIVTTLLVKPKAAATANREQPNLNVNLMFVNSTDRQQTTEADSKTIEGEVVK